MPALIAAVVAVVLVVAAGAYGPHRDELYFLVAGRHLAWSFADQGPLTPAIAHLADLVAPGSLTVLRLPSALMTAGGIVLTGLTCRELGGTQRAQVIAAACTAVSSIFLFTGHLLSTTTFDLLAWTALTFLVVRAVRTGDAWLWPIAGAVAGLALLNKPLIAFLLAALAIGVVVAGPRTLLRTPMVWVGAVIALGLWAPWLVWQAQHGWPQLDVSSAIAAGESGSSEPRWALLPFQLLLVSPVLAPVWIAGLVALARSPALRPYRLLAVAWLALVVIFLATGGKPYYLAGLFPVLLAAGAVQVDAWLERGRTGVRAGLLWGAVALSAIVSAVICLPVLPERDAGAAVAMNGDVGETIGWPELVATVAAVARTADRPPVVFTANYGEAGAIERYGAAHGLGRAYSGHNAFGDWGPPPDGTQPVVAVGLGPRELEQHFRGCRVERRITNQAGIDNDESGAPVALCAGPRRPWARAWPALEHLG